MNRTSKVAFALLALALTLPDAQGEDKLVPKDKEKAASLMQKKLQQAQKLLEGVALNDFALMSKSADELIRISKDAEWRVIKSPRYEIYSDQFRANAEAVIKSAKEKNVDGAALAYVEMTLSCVKCHKYVREERMGKLDGKPRDWAE